MINKKMGQLPQEKCYRPRKNGAIRFSQGASQGIKYIVLYHVHSSNKVTTTVLACISLIQSLIFVINDSYLVIGNWMGGFGRLRPRLPERFIALRLRLSLRARH